MTSPLLLDGLQRSLRPLRKEWNAAFAAGGEEALAVLEREPFDVIVTDMRMPGMDGATAAGRGDAPLSGHAAAGALGPVRPRVGGQVGRESPINIFRNPVP